MAGQIAAAVGLSGLARRLTGLGAEDPAGTARFIFASPLADSVDAAGRKAYAGRPPAWAALEDKCKSMAFGTPSVCGAPPRGSSPPITRRQERPSPSRSATIIQNPGQPGGRHVDRDQVLSLFVLEPRSFARLKVDNIRLISGHVAQRGGGIQPP